MDEREVNALADQIVVLWLNERAMTTREVSDRARAVVRACNSGRWRGSPDDPYVVLTVRASARLQGLARRGEIAKVKGPSGRCLWFTELTVLDGQGATHG